MNIPKHAYVILHTERKVQGEDDTKILGVYYSQRKAHRHLRGAKEKYTEGYIACLKLAIQDHEDLKEAKIKYDYGLIDALVNAMFK